MIAVDVPDPEVLQMDREASQAGQVQRDQNNRAYQQGPACSCLPPVRPRPRPRPAHRESRREGLHRGRENGRMDNPEARLARFHHQARQRMVRCRSESHPPDCQQAPISSHDHASQGRHQVLGVDSSQRVCAIQTSNQAATQAVREGRRRTRVPIPGRRPYQGTGPRRRGDNRHVRRKLTATRTGAMVDSRPGGTWQARWRTRTQDCRGPLPNCGDDPLKSHPPRRGSTT